jgi:hypothetical protein
VAIARRLVPAQLEQRVEQTLDAALDKAITVQRPAVLAYLRAVRERNPDADPATVVTMLEKHYRATVIGIGTAAGAVAALPAVGTMAGVAAGAAEITAFVSATAMFVLAMAEVHGVPVSDPLLRRALVLAVLVGESGEAILAGAQLETPHWAQVLGRSAAKDRVTVINNQLTHLLLTRVGTRQGALVLGRALPLGIGAGVGAVGNAALARSAIRSARRAFGPAPRHFRGHVIDA